MSANPRKCRGYKRTPKPRKVPAPYMWRGVSEEFGIVFCWKETKDTQYISFRRQPIRRRQPAYIGWDYDRHRWTVRPFGDGGPIPRIPGTWRYHEFGRTKCKLKSKITRRMLTHVKKHIDN